MTQQELRELIFEKCNRCDESGYSKTETYDNGSKVYCECNETEDSPQGYNGPTNLGRQIYTFLAYPAAEQHFKDLQ